MPTFKQFDFEILQLRYLKAAMDELPTFQPDGKTAADVQTMRDDAETVKVAFQTADGTLALARGELQEIAAHAHLLCIQVYPIMKSRYRKDAGSLQAIGRLPVDDKTVRQTRERMKAISLLWGQLPNPPGALTAFEAWGGMDLTAFDAVLANLVAQDEALPATIQAYEKAQSDLHQQMDAVEDFVTAALIQGRAQFPDGSPEREIIDAIPMEPAQQPPAQAVITLASSPGPGQVLLEFDAARATMFDVWQKGPGDADFVEVATDVIDRTYAVGGLADGNYQFRVSGQNSLGNGPLSEVAQVEVGSGGGGLTAPSGLTLLAQGDLTVSTDWDDVAGADFYRVLVEVVPVGSSPSDAFSEEPTTFPTSNATLGPYDYEDTVRVKVRAADTDGDGPDSSVAEITMPSAPPPE